MLSFLCEPIVMMSQTDSTHTLEHISEDSYSKLVKEVTYEKNKSKLLPKKFDSKKKKSKKKKSKTENINTDNLSFLNGDLVKVIIYALIGILLLVVIYMLLANIKLKDKTAKTETEEIDHEIENIEEVDTDDGISTSFSEGNYRLTCRMIFLKVLQQLQKEERIKWRPEKTNRQYVRELSGDKNEFDFKNLATVYENVWYGDKPIYIEELKEYAKKSKAFITINNSEL